MSFVFTSWYFVMLALVAGIVACIVVFVKMDKKDRMMIKEFVEKSQQQEQEKAEEAKKEVNSEQQNN